MLHEKFSMTFLSLILSASCISWVCALSMSYSFSSSCTSGCSDEVLSALGDQEQLCAIEDLTCVYDCISAGMVDAHCECGTTALFRSYSFDFFGAEEYCCGSSSCQAAVADLYTNLYEDSKDDTEATLLAACSNVDCTSYSISYSQSISYSFSSSCTSGCSDEVLSALGDQIGRAHV